MLNYDRIFIELRNIFDKALSHSSLSDEGRYYCPQFPDGINEVKELAQILTLGQKPV